MNTLQIKHRHTQAVLHEGEYESFKDALIAALKTGACLRDANLRDADLRDANLIGADLRHASLANANLTGANLWNANLWNANLRDANLWDADLRHANLIGADLRHADLRHASLANANLTGANLWNANLWNANLWNANLRDANLANANLTGANLTGANLTDADLREAKNTELTIAKTRILPEGDLIGWKKCQKEVIVKIKIPAEAKRSHAFGRKCRAEFVDVLEVIGADTALSQYDCKTEYKPGIRVTCDKWSDYWLDECAGGIHFFITRLEAEAH